MLASSIRPSVRAVKVDKFPSAVQKLTCRPKASSSSAACFDEKRLPPPKNVLHLFSDQNSCSNLLSVTWGKEEDCPGHSGRKKISFFLQVVGAPVVPEWDWIAVQETDIPSLENAT